MSSFELHLPSLDHRSVFQGLHARQTSLRCHEAVGMLRDFKYSISVLKIIGRACRKRSRHVSETDGHGAPDGCLLASAKTCCVRCTSVRTRCHQRRHVPLPVLVNGHGRTCKVSRQCLRRSFTQQVKHLFKHLRADHSLGQQQHQLTLLPRLP